MDRFKGKYGKVLAKADEYLRKDKGSDSSSSSGADQTMRGIEAEGGGYKAYLKKAKEFLHKKEADDEKQVDGANNGAAQEDKMKQYMAVAVGLWHARKKHKKRRRRGNEGQEKGEEEEEDEEESGSEEDEDDDDDDDEDDEGGWFGKFVQGLSEMLGDESDGDD